MPLILAAGAAVFLILQISSLRSARSEPSQSIGSGGSANLTYQTSHDDTVLEQIRELRKEVASLRGRQEHLQHEAQERHTRERQRGSEVKQGSKEEAGEGKPVRTPKLSHRVSRGDLVPGKHYLADYDIWSIKPATPDYNYPPKPAFHYPEDLPNFPDDVSWVQVSNQPKVYYFPTFITAAQADAIIVEASKRLSRSTVGDAGQSRVSDERTSEGCWMDDTVPAVKVLRDQIQRVTGWSRSDFEMTQVLRYQKSQKYNQHVDYMDPQIYGDSPINRERAVTFFTWLEDMDEDAGGMTVLPMANGGPPAPGYGLTCDRGLRVRPRKGAAIAFYDQKPDKSLDPYSLHGACPVLHGIKWVVPQWLWTSGRWDKKAGLHSRN